MCRRTKSSDVNAVLILNNAFLRYSIKKQFDPTLASNKVLIKGTKEELKKRILNPIKQAQTPVFVAERRGKIIGFITGCVPNNSTQLRIKNAILQNIFISKTCRRGGEGTKLVKKFISFCKKRKINKIMLEFYSSDLGAKKFYTSKFLQFTISTNLSQDPLKTTLELNLTPSPLP